MKRLTASMLYLGPLWTLAHTSIIDTSSCESNGKVLFSCQIKNEQIAYCGGDNKKGLQWLRFKQSKFSDAPL